MKDENGVKWARGEGLFEGQNAIDVQTKGHKFGTIKQWSKGCLIDLGINGRVLQKVANVSYF